MDAAFLKLPLLAQHGSLAREESLPTLSEAARVLTLQAGFNTTIVILGATLLGIAAGLIGVFSLLRKRALMADALSHATLPGIAAAFLAASALGTEGRSLPVLLLGAAVTGVLGVLTVQWIVRYTRLKEDAAIGIVLSVYFGVGVVLLSIVQSSSGGNQGGLNTFIYGQTAAMLPSDVALIGAIAGIAILAAALLTKEFALVAFNDAFAKVSGWPVTVVDLLMMALVVLVTIAGLQAVGLILVVAMLIIPPVAARFWTERLWLLLVLAAVFGGLSGYLGASASALFPRRPAGAVIVLTSGAIFAVSLLLAPTRGVIAASLRRGRLRLRIAADHLLEAAYERDTSDPRPSLTATEIDSVAHLRAWPFWYRPIVLAGLRWRKQAIRDGGDYRLTPRGVADGARISRNHRLWEQYLITHADVAPSHVDWSVDLVEHVLPEEIIAQLEEQLDRPGAAERASPRGVPSL